MKSNNGFFSGKSISLSGFSKSYTPNFIGIGKAVVPLAFIVLVLLDGFGIFGIETLKSGDKTMLLVKIAILAFVVFAITQVAMPALLKSMYNQSSWKASSQWFQSLIYHTAIVVGSLFLISSATGRSFDFIHAILFLVLIATVSAIAISTNRNRLETKNSEKAQEITAKLGHKTYQKPAVAMHILNFSDGQNKFSIVPNQLIYASTTGNSTTFLTQTMVGVEQKTLNISAADVNKELTGYSQFTKFANNLIVNELAIKAVTGHAGGFELELAKIKDRIAVENKYVDNLDNL